MLRFLLLPLFSLALAAQSPSFEVASIRPSTSLMTSVPLCGNITLSPESVLVSVVYRLDVIISEAYFDQVDDWDLPSWTRNGGTFALSVKVPPNTSVAECRQMLRNFLAERFHMVLGVETRDVARYYLKVAKSGLKLKAVTGPPADLNASSKYEIRNSVVHRTYRAAPMSKILNSLRSNTSVEAFALSFRLTGVNGLVDETGLTGYYDGEFTLNTSIGSRRDEFAESLSDALTRQLGLTLELRRVPRKVLILESSDRMPTEN